MFASIAGLASPRDEALLVPRPCVAGNTPGLRTATRPGTREYMQSRPVVRRRSACALLLLSALLVCQAGACARHQSLRLEREALRALERGEAEVAVAKLEGAAMRAPQAASLQNHLGLAYAAAGRDLDALAAFGRAVDLDCNDAVARANLGAARLRVAAHLAEGGKLP